MSRNDLLGIALAAAVPLHIAELQRLRYEIRWRQIRLWASEAVDVIASKGDLLLYRNKQRGETASAFNHAARGLAALAHAAGGVTFDGHHWCVEPHPCCPNERPEIDRRPMPTPPGICRYGTHTGDMTRVEWQIPSPEYL